jgi:phage shock protein PspC (stress-responsive transcriptional regulator)
MNDASTSLIARDDTFLGVCAAIGEDFGFSPNWLRIALAIALFWNPLATIGTYAGAGVLVALTRWVAPNPRITVEAPAAEAPAPAPAEEVQEALPLAA